MSVDLAALLYLVSGALFIMALRGLSSPATSRQGNLYGMVGMAIAILTTLAVAAPTNPFVWIVILAGIAIWTPNRRYHLALVSVHLIYQAWWIYILFYTHATAG